MTSYMNIVIRVGAAKAMAQIDAMRASMAGLYAQTKTMSRTSPIGAGTFASLTKYGSRLQWVGRQLQYNFTLPIMLAMGLATKFAMDQEKSFTHVAKVYGDVSSAAKQFRKESDGLLTQVQAENKARRIQRKELAALDDAFTAISNHYGVQKKDVLEVAGAWAAAGASGRRLAESVNATMQAMIIGDMDATKATDSLISIQAQYNLNSKQLMQTLAMLNNVENQTGISMGGLIDGFSRAAGVARAYGVDTRHLAADLAALVPATGSAATAGNALKTIFSRLMAPTKETTDVLKAMNIHIGQTAWQSASAQERLQLLNKKFEDLGSSAQAAASSVIASRWQVNKFEVLMDEMAKKTGFYAKALDASKNAGDNFKVMQNELNTVLNSNPQKLKRMGVILQNVLVKIIQPMIPYIIFMAQEIGKLAQKFASLDPSTQKLILFALTALALLGPLIRYFASFGILIGVLGTAFVHIIGAFTLFGKAAVWLIGGPLGLLRKAFLIVIDTMMLMIPASVRTAGLTATIWGGLGRFLAAWNVMVSKIFAVGNLLRLRIWTTGLMSTLAATKAWAVLQLLNFKVFWLKMRLLFIAGSLEGVGIFKTMYMVLKELTIVGLATQFGLFRKFLGVVAIFKTLGSAIVVAWSMTWEMLKAVTVAGWALIRAQMIVGAIANVGIFTRMRAALVVVWSTTAAAASTIWKGMALTMVAFSRAAVVGVVGVFKNLIPFILRFGRFLFSWPALLVAAVIGITYHFRDQIKQGFADAQAYVKKNLTGIAGFFDSLGQRIMGVFHMLPQGVQSAMQAVVSIISSAAKAVYGWFSYINPFAHHSPSLVENVTKGMDVVVGKFATLGKIKQYTDAAYKEVSRFGKLTSGLNLNADVQQQKQDRKDIKKSGAGPGVLASYNKLTGLLNKLQPTLTRLNAAMQAQQAIVNSWQSKVDAANAKLDVQQKKLDALQAVLDKYNNAMSAAKGRLDSFASAPLKGMQAMDDQIQANTVSQNKLRLAMMNMEDAVGPLDKIQGKLDSINATQEMLRGKRSDLAAGGAGSDILSTYDNQIKSLDKQKQSYNANADALQKMQDRLDALQRTADRLDLVKALKFDDLNYQIQKAANTTKELSFKDIMKGVQGAQADMAKYGDKIDKASQAVDRQQKVVDKMTAARDRLQSRLDKEQKSLDKITAKYNQVNDAVQAIKDSIDSVVSSAQKMNAATAKKKGSKGSMSPGLENFLRAGKSGFPDAGGLGLGPRKNWHSQVKGINAFTKKLAGDTASMFDQINPFKPLVEKAKAVWAKVKDWWNTHADGIFGGVRKAFSHMFGGVHVGGLKNSTAVKQIVSIAGFITKVFKDVGKFLGKVWSLIGPDVKKIGKGIWDGLKSIWTQVGPEIEKFGRLWKPLGKAIENLWTMAKPWLAALAAGFALIAKVVVSVLAETVGPVLKDIGTILAGVFKFIRGFFEIIIGLLSGDWKLAWQGVVDILGGAVKAIWGLLKGLWHIVKGIVWGIVKGIWNFFKWLFDELLGHSIIPDIINGIWKWFKKIKDLAVWVWEHVLRPVFNFFKSAWDKIHGEIVTWWPRIKTVFSVLFGIAKWFWDHILKPLWDKFTEAFGKIRDVVSGVKDKISELVGAIGDKIGGLVDNIKAIPGKIKNLLSDFKDAGKTIINGLWEGMKNAGTIITDLAGSIWNSFRDRFNAGITLINNKIPDKIGVGKLSIDLPDNPFPPLPAFYRGGIVPGSRHGMPITAGDRGHSEAIIPLTGPYAPRWARYQDQPFNPRSMASVSSHREFHFYGDLSFPNVKSGDDVETLISNLESLAS